jgi:hypothetical protein
MVDYTTKSSFLDRLLSGREQWEALLARVPAVLMTVPGATGIWSVKDVIAHIGAYERWTADQVEAGLRGETRTVRDPAIPPEADSMTMDERNDLLYRMSRDRTLEDVVTKERLDYQRLLADLQGLSDEAFASTGFAWTEGIPLGEALVGNTFGHYEEHIPWIEAFLRQQGRA